MRLEDALKRDGVAYRDLTHGCTSIRASNGKQWTLKFYKRENRFDVHEISQKYAKLSDDYSTWEPLRTDTIEFKVLSAWLESRAETLILKMQPQLIEAIGAAMKCAGIRGLLADLKTVDDLKLSILMNAQELRETEVSIRLVEKLDLLLHHAKQLKEML